MTSWQGNPNTMALPAKASHFCEHSTKPNWLFQKEEFTLCSLWYIIKVQPDSACIVHVHILGANQFSLIIMHYVMMHSVSQHDTGNSFEKLICCLYSGVYFYYLIIILNQNQKLLWNSGATLIYNCIIIISHCCVLASASSLSYCVLLSAIFRYKERGVCSNLALNIKIPVKACWCASDVLLPHNFFVSVAHFLYLHPPTVSVGLGSSLSSEAQTLLSHGVSRLGERTDLSSVSRISSQADMHKPPPRGRRSGSILTRCSKQRSSNCIYLFFFASVPRSCYHFDLWMMESSEKETRTLTCWRQGMLEHKLHFDDTEKDGTTEEEVRSNQEGLSQSWWSLGWNLGGGGLHRKTTKWAPVTIK